MYAFRVRGQGQLRCHGQHGEMTFGRNTSRTCELWRRCRAHQRALNTFGSFKSFDLPSLLKLVEAEGQLQI
eukprot:797536-Pleurochrysis_carterae.AAC.3